MSIPVSVSVQSLCAFPWAELDVAKRACNLLHNLGLAMSIVLLAVRTPRAALPLGKREGCTVRARVRISAGALLQMGMDYWLSQTVPYGSGGNNHEAGASNWYFPSPQWQEATFTDVGGPQF